MSVFSVTVALLFAPAPGKPAPSLESLAQNACGICLAEVTRIKPFDNRPADGNAGLEFHLKIVRSSGAVRKKIIAVTAFGGLRPPGAPVPKPSRLIRKGSLTKGKRYWIAFASEHQWQKYDQGVINFWPEFTPKVADVFDKAITAKRFAWSPQYSPELDLSYGYKENSDLNHLRVRVTRRGKVLWEKSLSGKRVQGLYSRGLWHSRFEGLPTNVPKGGRILIAETRRRLKERNDFGVPASNYRIRHGFDPTSGRELAVWVSRDQPGLAGLHVNRDYDPKTGKLLREDRYDWHITGGLKVGAKKDKWSRKTVRMYDRKTGREVSQDVFRYDYARGPGKRWVKLRR